MGTDERTDEEVTDDEFLDAINRYLDSVEEDWARRMTDDELLEALGRLDPEGERDDLTGRRPVFDVAHLWREADRRGLLDRA